MYTVPAEKKVLKLGFETAGNFKLAIAGFYTRGKKEKQFNLYSLLKAKDNVLVRID